MFKSTALLSLAITLIIHTSWAQKGGEVFENNGLYGIRSADHEILVQPNFKLLGWSDNSVIVGDNVVGYYDGNWGLISLKGKKLTKPLYYDLRMVDNGLIIAGIKGQFSNRIFYGLLNEKGKVVLGFNYTSIVHEAGIFIVTEIKNERKYYGLVNSNRKFLLNTDYLHIGNYSNDLYIFTNKENKKGLVNTSGQIVLSATLDNIEEPNNGYSIITRSGGRGLLSDNGKIEIEPAHKDLKYDLNSKRVSVENFSDWAVIDSNNQTLASYKCDSISKTTHNYLIHRNDHIEIVREDFSTLIEGERLNIKQLLDDKVILTHEENWGVIGQGGNFIDFQYDSIFSDTTYYYAQKNNLWSVFNKFGRKITRRDYMAVKPASESLIATKRNGYWGFIDFQGDEVIDYKYDYVEPFYNRSAKVMFLDSYGTIDHFGQWVCEPVYDNVEITGYGLTSARVKDRTDVLNQAGNIVFQTYNDLSIHELGFLESTAEGQKGIVADYGGIMLYPIFDHISELINDTLISVIQAGRIGALNNQGKWYILPTNEYDDIYDIGEGLLAMKKHGLHGFINLNGLLRIANRYDSVQRFSEGYAAVKLRGQWGFINKREELKIQPHYSQVGPFKNGSSIVRTNGLYAVIDKEGEFLLEPEYTSIERLASGYFRVSKDDKFGLYNKAGNKIVSTRFNQLSSNGSDYFIAHNRGKYGLLFTNGLFTIPQVYSQIYPAEEGLYFCVKEGQSEDKVIP